MGFFFRKSTSWFILAGLVVPLSPALAQTSGQFTLAGSFTYAYDEIQHSSTTFTAGSLEGGYTVSRSYGALFPKGQVFLESCVVFSERSTGDLSAKGLCRFTEAQEDGGDELFAVATREQGDLVDANSGGMGHMDLVGGTGKYATITGHCSYETRYLSTSTAVAVADCTWSKP